MYVEILNSGENEGQLNNVLIDKLKVQLNLLIQINDELKHYILISFSITM